MRAKSTSLFLFALFSVLFIASNGLADKRRQSGKIIGEGSSPLKFGLTAPRGGWTMDRMVEVAGHLNDPTVNPLVVNINGDRYLLKNVNGEFKRKFPVLFGKNTILVQGTNKAGTFKESRIVYAQVPPVSFLAILTSDTDGVYTDLHIYEPAADGDPLSEPKVHVYWADTRSPSGGNFYLNEQGGDFDQPGYGPYLYTHSSPPVGIYRIDANYWPSGDKAHTLGSLSLVLFGGSPNEIRRKVQQPLVMPGETVTMAFVKIEKGGGASIYVPGIDPIPADTQIWPKWVLEAKSRNKKSGGEN